MLHPCNALGKHVLGSTNLPANYSAAASGTLLTPGTSSAEGAWTSLITATSAESAWAVVECHGGFNGGTSHPLLLDIGFDPAGGTAYAEKLSNLLVGNIGSATGFSGGWYLFPLRIPSGSRVAARLQDNNSVGVTPSVVVSLYGSSSRPEATFADESFEVVGTVTGSSGVTFTPGTGAWGSYVSLGTTAGLRRWWQLGAQLDQAAIGAKYYYVELAHGNTTNKHLIKRLAFGGDTAERVGEFSRANQMFEMSHWPLPAGTELFVRGMCDTTPDATWTALAYGMCG